MGKLGENDALRIGRRDFGSSRLAGQELPADARGLFLIQLRLSINSAGVFLTDNGLCLRGSCKKYFFLPKSYPDVWMSDVQKVYRCQA